MDDESVAADVCYLCDKEIKKGQEFSYYGGPFTVHTKCLTKIIEEA